MSQRFFADTPIEGSQATLSGPEAHHLLHVMRAQRGDRVALFDGSGYEFDATITQIERHCVTLQIDGRRAVDREIPFSLTLAVALPRGDRQDWLVEKCVELGVTRLVPWLTERSVAKPGEQSIRRLERTVIEASKQCGRNRLMQVDTACGFSAYVQQASGGVSLLADPTGRLLSASMVAAIREQGGDHGLRLGVGPEGGFTERELAQAVAAGWQLAQLGPRVLRVDTAAVVLSALVVCCYSA